MREFKVNEYITLKLEGEITNIYVKDRHFIQCKFLLLDVPLEESTSLDDIESIDEAAERLDKTLEPTPGNRVDFIPPEIEFWGHCSNIQTWVENDYNTNLLHSNIAFPLLKKLSDEGDPVAKKVFKEEIAKRIESGVPSVIRFLLSEGYIDYLSPQERKSILISSNPDFLNRINNTLKNERERALKLLQSLVKSGFPNIKEILKKELIKELVAIPYSDLLKFVFNEYIYYFEPEELDRFIFLSDSEIIQKLKVSLETELASFFRGYFYRVSAFPALKKLADYQVPTAKKMLIEQTLKVMDSPKPYKILQFIEQGYLEHFKKSEFKKFFEENKSKFLEHLPLLKKLADFKDKEGKRLFKEELFKKLNSGTRIDFIMIMDHYMHLISQKEIDLFLLRCEKDEKSNFFNILKSILGEEEELYNKGKKDYSLTMYDLEELLSRASILNKHNRWWDNTDYYIKLIELDEEFIPWIKRVEVITDYEEIYKEFETTVNRFIDNFHSYLRDLKKSLNEAKKETLFEEMKAFVKIINNFHKLFLGSKKAIEIFIKSANNKPSQQEIDKINHLLGDDPRVVELLKQFNSWAMIFNNIRKIYPILWELREDVLNFPDSPGALKEYNSLLAKLELN